MRRRSMAICLLVILLVGAAAPVLAAKPDRGCPGGQSDFVAYPVNRDWQLGDPLPQPGEDPWWDQTLAGFAAEGYSPQAAAELLGVATVAELYGLIVGGLTGLDRNGDGWICGKPFPEHQQGMEAYFYNAIDNNARAR